MEPQYYLHNRRFAWVITHGAEKAAAEGEENITLWRIPKIMGPLWGPINENCPEVLRNRKTSGGEYRVLKEGGRHVVEDFEKLKCLDFVMDKMNNHHFKLFT